MKQAHLDAMQKARRLRPTESAPDYPFVVAQLDDKHRVIECAADIQWVVQTFSSHWHGLAFCRTKEALLRIAGHHPALLALPDRYPDGHRVEKQTDPV